MYAKKPKLLMADLPGVIYPAKERKRPFYYPHELEEVMTQRSKYRPKVSKMKFNSMFDLLPHTIAG